MDTEITVTLEATLEKRGYRGRVVAIQHLHDLWEGIERHHRTGRIDEELYQERLAGFQFHPPESLPNARSVILLAYAQSQIRLTFRRNKHQIQALIPPTYFYSRQADKQAEETLIELLKSAGYRVVKTELPKKLLAVSSGLAQYGRNNISYIPGLGSFYRMAVFYSDVPCPQSEWQEPRMMDQCRNCTACLHHCPTGALTAERILIRGERCLTFHNYRPGHIPFPTWIDPSWHNCLIGCLLCQTSCPENTDFRDRIVDGEEFSSEETSLLLEGTLPAQLPAETVRKVEGIAHFIDRVPRNLKVLAERSAI